MPLTALAMAFASLVLIANVLAVKPIDLNGWAVPAGVLAYPFTFLVTDTISELYGRRVATRVVWFGAAFSVLMVGLIYAGKILPGAGFWEDQAAFDTILGAVPRIVLASLAAYLVSQHTDLLIFHRLRRLTEGKRLWLRNNASTVGSQAIDTVLFISIAFAGTVPGEVLWNLMYTQYLIKVGVAAIDTPIVYALVGFIRSRGGGNAVAPEPVPPLRQ